MNAIEKLQAAAAEIAGRLQEQNERRREEFEARLAAIREAAEKDEE